MAQNSSNSFEEGKMNYVGSMPILTAVFEIIDQNIFNGNLDGTKLEWCDELKSRAAICYEQRTFVVSQKYIRFSKAWFKNRSRKNFVEAVLYEATDLFLTSSGVDMDDNMHVYLLEAAIKNFDARFKTNMKVNYNYKQQESAADAAEIDKILNDLAIERTISSKKAAVSIFKMRPKMKLLTNRCDGNSRALHCPKEHGPICLACPTQIDFRARFFGANIYALFAVEEEAACILCGEKSKPGNLSTHFQNECEIFNPKSSQMNMYAPHAWL